MCEQEVARELFVLPRRARELLKLSGTGMPAFWRLIFVLLPVIHAAEWPPRPQLTQLQKKQLQGVSAALLTRSVVSQAAPTHE